MTVVLTLARRLCAAVAMSASCSALAPPEATHARLRVPLRRCRPGRCAVVAAASSSHAAQTAPRALLTTLSPREPTLGVSFYPDFLYDAGGDSVAARVGPLQQDGRRSLDFAVTPVTPVNGGSTTILGVPLPPFVNIAIEPLSLRGWFEPATGEAALDFDARFVTTLFGFTFPPLAVVAPLRTAPSVGVQRRGTGVPWRSDTNACILTAVARVPPTGNTLLDTFLQLPADALAVLPATLEFLTEEELVARGEAVGTRPPNEARASAAARAWGGAAAGVLAATAALALQHA